MMRSTFPALVSVFLALTACGSDGGGDGTPTGDAGPADARIDPPPDAAQPPEVRFVVIGDTGEGNEDQHMVADAIAAKCQAEGCEFVIMLGDNIYDSGVTSVDDPQWQTKFEEPYENIDLPFYVVLGNHDYGGEILGVDTGGVGNEWEKGPIEVEYTATSTKWTMPATHYTFTWGNIGFIMLDTNSIMWDNTDHGDQRAWYPTALQEVADADWVFAAGHHPYLSNGSHGNAGSYESIEVGGIEIPNPFDTLNGQNVKDFFDQVVCNTVHVYFAGHDHNRQWLNEPDALCGAELIVSGAGAKVKEWGLNDNESHWQDDATPGFLYVVVRGDVMRGQFIDKSGQLNFEREITRFAP